MGRSTSATWSPRVPTYTMWIEYLGFLCLAKNSTSTLARPFNLSSPLQYLWSQSRQNTISQFPRNFCFAFSATPCYWAWLVLAAIMENLRHFRVKFLSWARWRNKFSNHEPHRLTSPHIEVARPNILSGLVAELLLSIADFLPPKDIYCLPLCNHRLFSTFESKRSREKLQNNSRFSFLRRLQLDNHEYITCYICCALHKYDCGTKSFGL